MDSYDYIILDAFNLAYRNWWPVRESVTSAGRDNSLERGFCTGLLSLKRRFATARLLVAWDGKPVQQLQENQSYKAQRKTRDRQRPADWHQRCDRLREALAGLFPMLYDAQNEADVEIARFVRQHGQAATLIASSDRDFFMLLTEHVDALRPGSTPEIYRLADFNNDYGLSPCQYPLYKALVGEKSDNLAGVGRFPSKVAKQLAAYSPDVDALYQALHQDPGLPVLTTLTPKQRDKLLAAESQVRSNVLLMDLLADAAAPHLKSPTGDIGPLRALLTELELRPLADALEWELTLATETTAPVSIDRSSEPAPVDLPVVVLPPATSQELETPTVACASTLNPKPSSTPGHPSNPAPSGLLLTSAWVDRLAAQRKKKPQQTRPLPTVPIARDYYADKLTFIADDAGVQSLVNFAQQRPIAFIGIDFEFCYRRPGVLVKKDHTWQDPRSIMPLLMSLALVEPQEHGPSSLYRFVVDLRRPEILGPLVHLFRLPVKFVAHFGQVELFCLWQLGFQAPDQFWDTWTAERTFLLGIHHGRYQKAKQADEVDEARAKEEADGKLEFNCKLVTTCVRRGVTYPFAGDKEQLQRSFLTHPIDQPFSDEQLQYAAADAQAAAELFPMQVQVAVEKGCLDHLTNLEMPWTVTNANMIWNGVRVDPALCQEVHEACQSHIIRLSSELAEMGVGNARSNPQLQEFFRSTGLLEAFRDGGKYSFDDDHLKAVEDRHPSIPLIRHLRKTQRLVTDKLFTGELVGADGRLHPEHRQLGAESGRNTMSCPNIGGVGRALRPLVVPAEGYLIGECDLSQIEVGIAAAVYGDPDLTRMFNGRDVYTAMAKRYYASELPPDAQALPDKVFKKKHRHLRDRMKVFTLATIYNITPIGLSRQLGITETRAAQEREKFMAMFPAIAQALQEASEYGAIRGYAYLCSGLRRWRARTGAASSWEVNWMRNTPVQGSAGVVFKAAGNRLHRRYQYYGAKLILPMHDAFVFEVPHQHLQVVAKITAEVMRSTVQEYFPALDPQVDINIDQPHCWNKDGKHRSLRLWMANPELARNYL